MNQVDPTPSIVYIPLTSEGEDKSVRKVFPTMVEAQQFLIDMAEKYQGKKAYLFANPLVFKL